MDEFEVGNHTTFRWVVGILIAALFGLAGLVWTSVTGQINDMKLDAKVISKDINEVHVSVQDLKTQLGDLVRTLDKREGDRMERDSPRKKAQQ
jgi:hypothetical protein